MKTVPAWIQSPNHFQDLFHKVLLVFPRDAIVGNLTLLALASRMKKQPQLGVAASRQTNVVEGTPRLFLKRVSQPGNMITLTHCLNHIDFTRSFYFSFRQLSGHRSTTNNFSHRFRSPARHRRGFHSGLLWVCFGFDSQNAKEDSGNTQRKPI